METTEAVGLILAGGFGTRLQPLTFERPKPLLPVAGISMLERQVELLKECGIQKVILSAGFLAHRLFRRFGDGKELGIRLDYAVEDSPLGTGGAIAFAASRCQRARFVVLNGDIITDVDLGDVLRCHQESGALATLVLIRVANPRNYGLVLMDESGRVKRFVEKPGPRDELPPGASLINAGIYVLEPDALAWFPPGRKCSVEREVFPAMIQAGQRLNGMETAAYWLDAGTLPNYIKAHVDALERRARIRMPGFEKEPGVWLGPGSRVASGAVVRPPVLIGDGTVVEESVVGPGVVLGGNTLVGESVRIERTVALGGNVLEPDASVSDCILDEGARVGARSSLKHFVLASHSYLARGCRHLPADGGGGDAGGER